MSEDPYLLLDAKLKRIQALNSISGLISWDELVNLPEDSADQRQEQCAAMAQVCHAASVDPEIDTLLSELETRDDELDGDQRIVIQDARKSYNRSAKLPAEFVSTVNPTMPGSKRSETPTSRATLHSSSGN